MYASRFVGWKLATSLAEADVSVPLLTAIRKRQPTADLIHHTDRGNQYADTHYRVILRRGGLRDSMSRPDNAYIGVLLRSPQQMMSLSSSSNSF